MKMRATLTVEYEAEYDASNPEYSLRMALSRVEAGMIDRIEGVPGALLGIGIIRGSTKIRIIHSAITK